MLDLNIGSPKRNLRTQNEWEGFYPYYAGYPEAFALNILKSARLSSCSVVFDPWNGSGTTTFAASRLGISSVGFDINPTMLVVARARLLSASEADSIEPITKDILRAVRPTRSSATESDPLLQWFGRSTAYEIRAIERSICRHLVGAATVSAEGVRLENLSGIAATFYVALFAVCRQLGTKFRSTNPTWFRRPQKDEPRIGARRADIHRMFRESLQKMTLALMARNERANHMKIDPSLVSLKTADSTSASLEPQSVDFMLTSPPYCTRIDYAASTRFELAILHPLIGEATKNLRRKMMGSIQVPAKDIRPRNDWGSTCLRFLNDLYNHPSKASKGYYYKTHLDYFDKMATSLDNICEALKSGATAVMVIQESFYKDIRNDLPGIICEMGAAKGLQAIRRVDFVSPRSMSGINRYTRAYQRPLGAVESVLCFERI